MNTITDNILLERLSQYLQYTQNNPIGFRRNSSFEKVTTQYELPDRFFIDPFHEDMEKNENFKAFLEKSKQDVLNEIFEDFEECENPFQD